MAKRFHCLKPLAIGFIVMMVFMFHSSGARALSDEIIKQRIEAEVSDTSELKGSQVRVDAEKGFVVLSGTVRLYSQKMLYEKIAWQTMGVEEVENEIRVTPSLPLTDKAIELRIRDLVKTHNRLHTAEFSFTVKNGAVVLHGTFVHPRNVLFLKHKIAEIEGVIAIEIHATFNV